MKISSTALLLVGFLALAVFGAAFAWVMILIVVGFSQQTLRINMLMEVAKLLVQFVLITLIGATATFLYNQYGKEREQRQARLSEDNKLRRGLLDSLITVRANVEKARREYRLVPVEERKDAYEKTIQSILAARLELSQVWHDTETWKELYPGSSDRIQSSLIGMKDFLDNLVDEYEAYMAQVQTADPHAAERMISALPCFGTFVTGDGGPAYTKVYLEQNYRTAAREIRRFLLHPEGRQESTRL